MWREDGVVIGTRRGLRIGVNERGSQARHGVQEVVLGVDGDLVRLNSASGRIDDDLALGAQLMTNPPQPDLPDIQDSGGSPQGLLGLVHEFGVNGIHQAPVDLACCLAQHRKNGHRNQQPDYRVGPLPADRDAADAEEDGQRREAVSAGVQSVGHQCR